MWTSYGVVVCNATNRQNLSSITSDASNDAIIAWADARSGAALIYAQHLNSAGLPLWLNNGVPVSTVVGFQSSPLIIHDGCGSIFSWLDTRNVFSGTIDVDIFASAHSSASEMYKASMLQGLIEVNKVATGIYLGNI